MQPSVPSTEQHAVPTTTTQASITAEEASPMAQAASTSVEQTAVQSPTALAPQAEDLYAYQKCTIMIVVQLRPQVEDGRPRPVLLSVQNGTMNKEDLPLYRLLASENDLGGPFPPALASLLDELQRELPARKQRHEQCVVKRSTAGEASTRTVQKSSQASAKDAGKQKRAAASTKPAPPVSATATPLPKEGLVLGGLFDDL